MTLRRLYLCIFKTYFKHFLLVLVLINSLFFLMPNSESVYSQKVVLPQTYNLPNSTTPSPPSVSAGELETYASMPLVYCVGNSSSRSIQLTDSSSYTITNATTTLTEKIVGGVSQVNPVLFNQTVVAPTGKTINGL